jgi:hypothetical protein
MGDDRQDLNRQGAKSSQERQARIIDKIRSELGDLGVLAVNFSRVVLTDQNCERREAPQSRSGVRCLWLARSVDGTRDGR